MHQRDAGTLNTGYRLHGELGDVAQQFADPAAARDDSGQPVQPGLQVAVVSFQLVRGEFGSGGAPRSGCAS